MQPFLVLVLLGLACQSSHAMSLAAVEKHEAEQTDFCDKLLSLCDNILEKLALFGIRITGLRKDDQLAESMEDLQIPTQGSMIDKIDERLLESFEKIGAKYYHIGNDEQLDWFGALAKCNSLNGSLLSLKNDGQWNAIIARMNQNSSYWVNLDDIRTEAELISETSGEAAEPDNVVYNENCAEVRSGYSYYIRNVNCFAENNYICEANLDSYPKQIQN